MNKGTGRRIRSVRLGAVSALAILALSACDRGAAPRQASSSGSGVGAVYTGPGATASPAALVEASVRRPSSVKGTWMTPWLEGRPEVRSAASEVNAALDDINVARAGWYPTVSGGLDAGIGGGDPSIEAVIRQQVFDFGKTRLATDRSAVKASVVHLDFIEAVDEAIAEIIQTWHEIQALKKQKAIAVDRVSRLSRIAASIKANSTSGVTGSTDHLAAERRMQAARTDIMRIDLDLDVANRSFLRLTGRPADSSSRAISGVNLTCPASLQSVPVGVARAKLDRDIAGLDVEAVKKGRRPTLYLEASGSQNIASGSKPTYGLNFSVDTDFLKGGSGKAETSAATARLTAAQENLRAAAQEAQRVHIDALSEIEGQRSIARYLEGQIDKIAATLSLYGEQFSALGTRDLIEILDAEDEYANVKLELSQALFDHKAAQIACLQSGGMLRARLGLERGTLFGLALGG